jgi:hypothetical protein
MALSSMAVAKAKPLNKQHKSSGAKRRRCASGQLAALIARTQSVPHRYRAACIELIDHTAPPPPAQVDTAICKAKAGSERKAVPRQHSH